MNKSGGGSTSPQRAFGIVCHRQCVSEPVSLRLIRSLVERHALSLPSPQLFPLLASSEEPDAKSSITTPF